METSGAALPQPRDVNSAAPSGQAPPAYEAQQLGADELLKRFLADISDTSRDAEVQRVLSCFKLNPYEHLGLRFDAQPEDVKRQYRKVRLPCAAAPCTTSRQAACSARADVVPPQISLMVHPDKCKHPRARDAFEGTCSCALCVHPLTRLPSAGQGAGAAA